MSMAKKGAQANILQLQTGWDLNYSFDQTITGNASYKIDMNKVFTHKPKIGDTFEKLDKVKIVNVGIVGIGLEKAQVNVQLFGLENTPTRPIYSYYSSLSEEDIQTHPKFESHIAGSKGSEKNDALFNDDGQFLGFKSSSSFAGVRGYLTGPPIIRRTWFTTNVYSGIEDLSEIYKIQSGKIPGLPSGVDALKNGWSSRFIGANFYEISEEFLVSGDSGWNKTIYTYSDKN